MIIHRTQYYASKNSKQGGGGRGLKELQKDNAINNIAMVTNPNGNTVRSGQTKSKYEHPDRLKHL